MDPMFYGNDSSLDNEPNVGNTVIDDDYMYHIHPLSLGDKR